MRLVVNNISTQIIIGGKDFLLGIDLAEKLREYLRVRPDGYGHTDSYKEHKWDGYRYFITKDMRFATGFLPLVAAYATELGASIQVDDERKELPYLNEPLTDYIGMIDGEEWIGRDYQMELVAKLNNWVYIDQQPLFFPRGIYDAATNAGKNSITALIVKNYAAQYQTIFMVASIDIFKQAVAFFSQVIGEPVGQIKSQLYKPKWFTVCMVKSLHSVAKKSLNVKKFLSETKVLFVDESDEAGAKDYSKCLVLIPAPMRIFVSGTPLDGKKVNNMTNVGLSGQVLGTITNQFLFENGYSQKPIVKILLNNQKEYKFYTYADEVKLHIHKCRERALQIVQIIAERREKSILISFVDIEHGYFMYNILMEMIPDALADIVHGEDPDRAEKLARFKAGIIKILFASLVIKRGLNMPIIRVIIIAQGRKSKTELKQISGRGTRHDGIHDDMEMFDFYDTGRWIGEHSRKRIRIYKDEGFDVELMYQTRNGKPVL